MLDILDLTGPIAILYRVGVIQSSSPSHIILKSHHPEQWLRDAIPPLCRNSSTPESKHQQFERGQPLPKLISCTASLPHSSSQKKLYWITFYPLRFILFVNETNQVTHN